MIVSDLQFHSRFCVTSPPLEEASESWVCVRGRFSSSFLYLPVRLALCLVACPATTSYHYRFSIIGIIGIFDIIAFSFFAFHYFTENPFPPVLSYPFTFFRSE